MNNSPVELARQILALPEGPDYRELRSQAKAYIKGLRPQEYEELKTEALAERNYEDEEEEYLNKIKVFRQLGFTDMEAQAYARMRIDSPGVRRVIARRALLMQDLNLPALPPGTTFYSIAKMEDSLLQGMSDVAVMKALKIRARRKVGRRAEEAAEMARDVREVAKAETRRQLWSSYRGKATRQYIREHPEVVAEFEAQHDIEVGELPEYVTKASLTLELRLRARRRETAKAVREWMKANPEEAAKVRAEALRTYKATHGGQNA